MRGLFAGAGSAMMSSSLVVDAVLELTRKPDPRDVRLLYLGELGTGVGVGIGAVAVWLGGWRGRYKHGRGECSHGYCSLHACGRGSRVQAIHG